LQIVVALYECPGSAVVDRPVRTLAYICIGQQTHNPLVLCSTHRGSPIYSGYNLETWLTGLFPTLMALMRGLSTNGCRRMSGFRSTASLCMCYHYLMSYAYEHKTPQDACGDLCPTDLRVYCVRRYQSAYQSPRGCCIRTRRVAC